MTHDDEFNTTTFGPLETTNPKAAFGAAKAPFFGIPSSALIWLGNVMGGGGYKYGLFNYRKTRIAVSTYNDAITRHLYLYMDGEDTDPESGAPHLAHVMACCALLMDAQMSGKCDDDRSKTGLVRPMLELSAERFKEFKENHDGEAD